MNYNLHPQINAALALVKPHDPTAFVGGGALRDSILGVSIKDIDIFVGPGFDPARFEEVTDLRLDDLQDHVDPTEYQDFFQGDLKDVFCFTPFAGALPVQIVQMARGMTIREQLDRFDFSFCQVAWDGSFLTVGSSFYPDIERKIAGYAHTDEHPSYCGSVRRAVRLSDRFPGWRFIMPGDYVIRHGAAVDRTSDRFGDLL